MSFGMFDETLHYLDQIKQGMTYTMQVLPDEDGYIDKECPKDECKEKFKVYAEDWDKLFSDDHVYCPFCGHHAPADAWWTTEQLDQLKQQAIAKLGADLTSAMKRDARRFNRSQSRNPFLKFSLSVDGNLVFADLPAYALEKMEQKIQCEKCGARYAVIGSAFFCPCCGDNCARQTFMNSISTVRAKARINNSAAIRESIAEKSGKDEAERICQSLLETCIPDLVVAIQRLCECVYPKLPNALPPKRNVFQRLDDGNQLWVGVCGKGYGDWISDKEFSLLRKCFQQRHTLQHKGGFVDQDYISRSYDSTYQEGQRLIIHEEDVLLYCDIIEKLGKNILSLV